MLRKLLGSMAVLALVVAGATAQTQKNNENTRTTAQGEKGEKGDKKLCDATITKVDAKKGTVTVHMKDKAGKAVDKTFKLTEDIRMVDSTGRVAAIDVFQSGDEVLLIEAEGKLKELHKKPNPNAKEKSSK